MLLRLSLYFIFTLIITTLFQNCSNKAFEQKAISTKNASVNNGSKIKIGSIIHYNGVDNLHLGDPFKQAWELFSPSQIQYYEGYGYAVTEGDSVILLFDSYDSIQITSISFSTSKFKTELGVHPGMTIMELKKLYPDMWLAYNQIETTEEFYDPESLVVKKDKMCYSTSIIFSKAEEGIFIGEYEGLNERTYKFKNTGIVSMISVILRSEEGCK
jgi:hypothetical protein